MKKSVIVLMLSCILLAGCGKNEPQVTQRVIQPTPTPIPTAEPTPTVTEEEEPAEVPTEEPTEAVGWGNTPDFFPPEYDGENTDMPEIRRALFSVTDATQDIIIASSTDANDESNKDVLHGRTVNGQNPVDFKVEGNVVSLIQTNSDFGDSYSTDYEISKSHIENTYFTIRSNEEADEDTTRYSLNYYRGLLAVKTDKMECIRFKYEKLIDVTGQVGEFEFMVYPFNDENVERLGYQMLYVSGSTDSPAHITLEIKEHAIHITSDQEIDFNINGTEAGQESGSEGFNTQTGLTKDYEMTF